VWLVGYYFCAHALIPCLCSENLIVFVILIALWRIMPIVAGILGLIFGIISLRRISRNPELEGKGHVITGIVLSGL
jgi:sugar phosphate permease